MRRLLIRLFLVVFVSAASSVFAQKRPLRIDDIESWNRITETVLSPDGNWIAYKTEPWRGDSKVYLFGKDGRKRFEAERGKDLAFSRDSRFLVFATSPRPGGSTDSLATYDVGSGKLDVIKNVVSRQMPKQSAGWIAYQIEPSEGLASEGPTLAEREAGRDARKAGSTGERGFTLQLRNLRTGEIQSWPRVARYHFAPNAGVLFFVSAGDDRTLPAGLYRYDVTARGSKAIVVGDLDIRQVAPSPGGDRLAFLARPRKTNDVPNDFGLYSWTEKQQTKLLASSRIQGMPKGWTISENGPVSFSADGRRVFFGTAPARPSRDASITDDEFPDVDVWHGGEGVLHSVQLVDRERELKRTYRAMVDLSSGRFTRIETEETPESRLLRQGDADHAILFSSKAYQLESMWNPLRRDVYLLDLTTGRKRLILQGTRSRVEPSPGGKYLFWYDYADRSYHAHHVASGETVRVTRPETLRTDEEVNTTHDTPEPYGSPGWLAGDRAVLIHDRYDVWRVDPDGKIPPVNLTLNGRKSRTVHRLLHVGGGEAVFDENERPLLTTLDEVTRSSGYARGGLRRAALPETLIAGPFRLSLPQKAADAGTIVFTKETFEQFPDLWASDSELRETVRISRANPRQGEFLWGTAELVRWTSLDGRPLEGIMYKPEGFDPNKKYPMIVQFFHKSSNQLHLHRTPEFHRSRIDYHYFVSNGYLVFNPDIHFDPGYVGESAYKSIMPGVTALIDKGFVDPKRIGLQGHSYSGYQAAYLATRTNLFACIEAGAPVVNFFSAYGGIRAETGRSRAAQYEHDQTMATIWESPLRFLENSPLFAMDKVTTPILIVHNDQDGAVPWSQGIEYFLALRRLQRPVWMLNYRGEGHTLGKRKNKKDFQIRLAQFFDHYLKGEPMPRWMREGVPAVDRDRELGYGELGYEREGGR